MKDWNQNTLDRSRYYRDMSEGHVEIRKVTETLAKKMPPEMIATVLLGELIVLSCEFDLEQWETIKEELLYVREEFIDKVEPTWSNEIDRDEVEERYNKRYG